jgi:hypothetical protein
LHLISQEGCLSLHRRNSSARNRWMVDGGGFTVAFVSRCPRKEQRTWMQRHYFPDIMFHVMLFYWAGFGTNNGGVRVQHTCSNYLSISLFIINIYIHCTYIINMYLYIIYIIIYIYYIYIYMYIHITSSPLQFPIDPVVSSVWKCLGLNIEDFEYLQRKCLDP